MNSYTHTEATPAEMEITPSLFANTGEPTPLDEIVEALKRVAPLSYEAWIDYDVCGTRMSRMDLDALRRLISAEGEALKARDGASLDSAALAMLGLAKREASELLEKLAPLSVPDFELDLSRASSAETFAERFAEAVPKVDKKPLP